MLPKLATRQRLWKLAATALLLGLVTLTTLPRPQYVIQVFNILDYGAKCDGSTDDRLAITAAVTAACAQPGSILYTPPTTNPCIIGENGAKGYSILLSPPAAGGISCNNITFKGVRGKSFWKHPAMMANPPVAMIEIDGEDSITFDGMGLDGNWGNAATTITEASSNLALSGTYNINVVSTAGFPSSGPINVQSATGGHSAATQNNVVTCAGPNTATTFVSCTGGSGVAMRDFTVGFVDAATGINQITQNDPQSRLIFARGASNLTVQNSILQQSYGDAISMLGSISLTPVLFTTNAKILNNTFFMMARIGVDFDGAVDNALVAGNTVTWAHQESIDAEPVVTGTRSIVIRDNTLTVWWDPTQVGNVAVNINEGRGGFSLWGNSETSWRVEHNTIYGPSLAVGAWNLIWRDNTSIVDSAGVASGASAGVQFSPLQVEFGGGNTVIDGNYMYTRSPTIFADFGTTAAISVQNSGLGSDGSGRGVFTNPTSVVISNNTLDAQNGRNGISLLSPGGSIVNFTGTATAVTLTTVTDNTQAWVTNQFLGQIVQVGGAQAVISSNTATTLTLDTINASVTAWQTPLGEYAPTPTVGTYTISKPNGPIDVYGNHISLKNTSGFGRGSNGIFMTTSNSSVAFGRIRVHDNTIRDATGGGISIQFGAGGQVYPLVDIFRNYGFDDQPTPTMTSLVQFANTPAVTTWVLSDNVAGEGVANEVSGLTTGTFLLHEGAVSDWAGFGSPTGVVAAPVGSTYRQLNGAGAIITWTKLSGTGTLGWVADALQGTSPTFNGATLGAQVLSTASLGLSVSHGTLGTGSTNWVGNVAGVGANTSTALTLASGGFSSRSWCRATPNLSGTVETIVVTNSPTTPTFACFNATTGLAANCVDFTYSCVGQ